MTKSLIFIRLSWTAAPIPPKPAPTISTSKCSELMARQYTQYPRYRQSTALAALGFCCRVVVGCAVLSEQRRIVVLEFEDAADAGEIDSEGDQMADPSETGQV